MELLTSPKHIYILDAGLEALHSQSKEWLNEISFWREELDFLYIFIIKLQDIPTEARAAVDKLEKELFGKITSGELTDLNKTVTEHEHFLSQMIKTNRLDEESYRERHKEIAIRFEQYEKEFKQLKHYVIKIAGLVKDKTENDVLKTIRNRRAVRKYKDRQVEIKLIEQILDAGRMAPSAINKQPWKFYILTNKKRIEIVSKEIAKEAAKGILQLGIKKIAKTISDSFHLAHGISFLKAHDPIFHEAPVVIFITSPKENEWAALDIGMCAQNIMLAAKSMGLDSCPVGLGKYVSSTENYLKLNIPESEEVQLSIIIGYGDESPIAPDRNKDNAVYL